MLNCKLGLCSISFRKKTVEEIVKAVSEAGLEYIEWGSDVHAPCKDLETIEKIVSLQNQYGVKCSSYGTYFFLERDNLDELYDYIKAAKMLGTDTLRLWCGTKASAEYTPEERQVVYNICKEADKIAKKENVRFCMECHSNTFTDTMESSLELMKAIDSPNFLMYWQPSGLGEFELSLNYAKSIAPYTANIHVFYWINAIRHSLHEAIEIWRKYLAEFSGEKTLLLEYIPDDKLENVAIEAEALRKITL